VYVLYILILPQHIHSAVNEERRISFTSGLVLSIGWFKKEVCTLWTIYTHTYIHGASYTGIRRNNKLKAATDTDRQREGQGRWKGTRYFLNEPGPGPWFDAL
jgi:hypothetical protein